MILTILAWAATASVLFTYAWSVRNPAKAAAFHWANALGFLPLAVLNATLHAWPSVAINFGFGIPACYAVLREISRRRKVQRAIADFTNLPPLKFDGSMTAEWVRLREQYIADLLRVDL